MLHSSGKYSRALLVVMVVLVLVVLLGIEYRIISSANHQQAHRTASMLLDQVETVLEDNENKVAALKASIKEDYITRAKAVAYILDQNPQTEQDMSELLRIAELMRIDEIHIFDESGTIYAGTVPEYYGLNLSSGEQMAYFKPMLSDKTLAMCQDETPNTAEGKSMMYAIAWDGKGKRMIQIGVEPVRLLLELSANEIQEVIGSMPTYDGIQIVVADRETQKVLGATVPQWEGKRLARLGLPDTGDEVGETRSFTIKGINTASYCMTRVQDRYVIAIIQDQSKINQDVPVILLSMFLYLLLASVIITLVVRRMSGRIVNEHENANTDTMTGLRNRRAYEDDVKSMSKSAKRETITYLSLDLNGLKNTNDTLGHEAGDALIIGAAESMIDAFGNYGTLYRIGGDEFAAMLQVDSVQLAQARERFDKNLAAWTREHGRELTVSVGCVRASAHPELSLRELAKLADQKMYDEKARYYQSAGRDRRHRT